MLHWLEHAFGFFGGGGNSPEYLFWSGVASDLVYLSLLGSAVMLYRKHNCHQRRCWRIGRYDLTDPATGVRHVLCHRHHPDVHGKSLSLEKIQDIQQRRHLYLGDKAGRG